MEKNIYTALAEINKGIGAIKKDRKNDQQNFRYRGIDDVMNELHSLFADNEVLILPIVEKIDTSERTSNRGGVIFYVRVTVQYSFVHSTGTKISLNVIGEAMDSGDKAVNKAMSVALKYALLQMFLIPTEEDKDPDAKSYEIKAAPQAPAKSVIYPEMDEALFAVEIAETIDGLEKVWEAYPQLHKDKTFIDRVKSQKVKLLKPLVK